METRAPYALIGLFVLAAIGAVFGFVYWLNNSSGLTQRAVYRIHFENTVSGLLTGAAVLFNGIRVGEVTALGLDPDDPKEVLATIEVTVGTPLRADTRVNLDFQGLTGVPVIALQGGARDAARLPSDKNGLPLLVADPSVGVSMTEAARQALHRLDAVLGDNADNVKSTIANLNAFAAALARNSDRVDSILSGLARMTGVEAARPVPLTYDLTAPTVFPPAEKRSSSQLVVAAPTAVVAVDTQRILVAASAGEAPPVDEVRWSDTVPKLLQSRIVQSFENAEYLGAVSLPVDGLMPDYQLLIDIRAFEIEKSPTAPDKLVAHVAFTAKILGTDGKIAASRTFDATAPATDSHAPEAFIALNEAFGLAATQLVEWTASVI